MKQLLAGLFLLLLAVAPVVAVTPDEMLADPALEARARAISEGLRCLVCQNQSIDDSDAELAHELRVIVRERLTAGDTDAEARQFIVDRYGEYVLLNPVLAPHTILLWIAAPLLLLIGAVVVFLRARRNRLQPLAEGPLEALTPEEQQALDYLGDDHSRA